MDYKSLEDLPKEILREKLKEKLKVRYWWKGKYLD